VECRRTVRSDVERHTIAVEDSPVGCDKSSRYLSVQEAMSCCMVGEESCLFFWDDDCAAEVEVVVPSPPAR